MCLDEMPALAAMHMDWVVWPKEFNPQQHMVPILAGCCGLVPRSGLWGVSVPLARLKPCKWRFLWKDLLLRTFHLRVLYHDCEHSRWK